MMIKKAIYVLFLLLCLAACQQTTTEKEHYLSGKAVWDKMMAHYDPDGKLLQSAYRISFDEGANENQITLKSTITVSHPQQYCAYEQQPIDTTKRAVTMVWKAGKRLAIVNSDTLRTDEEIQASGLSTSTIDYYGTYYLYIFGLPSNMKTGNVSFPDTVHKGTFMGNECLLFPIQYPDKVQKERWIYYINPENFQIIGGSYDYADPKQQGAYAQLDGSFPSKNFQLIQNHGWFKADSTNWGFSKVVNITELNPTSTDWQID